MRRESVVNLRSAIHLGVFTRWLCVVLVGLGIGGSLTRAADEPIDFSRQIRPILSENCFACHGFDPGSREADLRLDVRDAALEAHEGQAAIVPGKPGEST
ncbi:MAG: hypothetical protein DWH91_11445, partial [Planctomycetota bacterium]